MITSKDLVLANLIHYFKAICEIEIRKNKLEALQQQVGVHSPNLEGLRGYTTPRDEKLVNYSQEIAKIQDELKGWEIQRQTYFNILHLNELDDQDIQFLTLRYKDKLNYEQLSKTMYYSSKQHAHRKDNAILEKLGKYIV